MKALRKSQTSDSPRKNSAQARSVTGPLRRWRSTERGTSASSSLSESDPSRRQSNPLHLAPRTSESRTEPVTFYRLPAAMCVAKQAKRWWDGRNWEESAKRRGRGCATVGTWLKRTRSCSRRFTPPSEGDAPSKAVRVRPTPEIRTFTSLARNEAWSLPAPTAQLKSRNVREKIKGSTAKS